MKTLKRMTVALLALLPLATGLAFADEEYGYSRIFVFGASFMDSGNNFALTGETAHPPFDPIQFTSYGVGGHHYSNGRTWVEVLAQEMGLTEWAKPAWRNPAFGNYAYGYARAREVDDPFGPSLSDQVAYWKLNGNCPYAPMDDTLFIVDSGYADFIDILQGENPFTVLGGMSASIAANIEELYECGARNLLLAYVVPAGSFPIIPMPDKGAINALSAAYNYVYLEDDVVDVFTEEPYNMNLSVVDFFEFFTLVMTDPPAYGFTNMADACITPLVTSGAFCKNRDEHFFWDALHQTKAAHALMAEYALGQLPVLE